MLDGALKTSKLILNLLCAGKRFFIVSLLYVLHRVVVTRDVIITLLHQLIFRNLLRTLLVFSIRLALKVARG